MPISEFNHGFFGSSGIGPGKHTNEATDTLDAAVVNRLENAIELLYSLESAKGLYGPFRIGTVSGVRVEKFNGDGTTTGFTLKKAISFWDIYNFDMYANDPYVNGISPTGLGGQLVSIDSGTKTGQTIKFNTAPPSGQGNVVIKYHIYSTLTSRIDGGSYLNDWTADD